MQLGLTQLLHLIEEMPAYRQLVDELERKKGSSGVAVLDAAKPYFIASLYHRLQTSLLVVTSQPENSKKLYEQLLAWCDSAWVKLFPEPDSLPYEPVASDNSTELEKLQVLSALASIARDGNAPALAPPLVVASAPAFMQQTAPYNDFTAACHTISSGMEVEPFQLLSRWQALGYRLESMVEVPGTISHRGGIIDIYPPTSDLPARLEFFGNNVDSIRLFDPANQRSLRTVSSVTVAPATELLTLVSNSKQPQQDSILNYLPGDGLLVLDEPPNIKEALEDLDAKAAELRVEKLERGELSPDSPRPYFAWEELEPAVKSRYCLELSAWGITDDEQRSLSFTPAPSYAGQLSAFIKKTKEMLDRRQRLILVSHQSSRLSELLEEEDIIAPPLTEVRQVPLPAGAEEDRHIR